MAIFLFSLADRFLDVMGLIYLGVLMFKACRWYFKRQTAKSKA